MILAPTRRAHSARPVVSLIERVNARGGPHAMVESSYRAGSTEALLGILGDVLDQLPSGREIALDVRLLELGVTSFQLMQIIAAVEQTLDIEFPDSALDLTTFESVGSLVATVDTLVREQSGSTTR
jgi:acyl carrier protein